MSERQQIIANLRDRIAELEAEERAEEAARAAARDDSEFYATEPQYDIRPYILPFGSDYAKWNPRDVDGHPFGKGWLGGMMGLVVKRTDVPRNAPSRIIFTSNRSGVPSPGDQIGERFEARHDQTNARLGDYEIVGIAVYGNDGSVARLVGDVPDRKLSLNTYK